MSSKILIYIFSVILILGGASTIIDPSVKSMTFFGFNTIPKGGDVTPIKWELGIVLIYLGIFLFYSEYKNKAIIKIQYSKCPRCKESFNYNELENGKCKYCKDIETIELEEYYKKYPEELKEE